MWVGGCGVGRGEGGYAEKGKGKRQDREGSRAVFPHLPVLRSPNPTEDRCCAVRVLGLLQMKPLLSFPCWPHWLVDLMSGLPESWGHRGKRGPGMRQVSRKPSLPRSAQRGAHLPPERIAFSTEHKETMFSSAILKAECLYTPSADGGVRSKSEAEWQTLGTHSACGLG